MKNRFLKVMLLCITLTLSLAVPSKAGAAAVDHSHGHHQCLSKSAAQLQWDLRKLWIDHALWTRNYIVSAAAGLEDQDKVLARLLKNQQDIGNAIKPYYGEAAGNKLAELLREHILIAGKIIAASLQGNQADIERYNKDWYKNADDIAKFLSGVNPNWSAKELKDLLDVHLQLVAADAAARIKKDWDADIAAFDEGESHIIKLSDTLATGIIKQFPDKFK
ncbi:glycosyltransferase [Paenibacillus solisilvae]|uniref:Glycosyltransferase n=1 Tax=Paenibacillus solisilvae TaxID=2486751 RepID=A0ABW0W3E8_9BACL